MAGDFDFYSCGYGIKVNNSGSFLRFDYDSNGVALDNDSYFSIIGSIGY